MVIKNFSFIFVGNCYDYVYTQNTRTKNKTYTSVYLAESYREGGKVKHRHISNLSKWTDETILSLEKILKGKEVFTLDQLKLSTGKSFGGIKVIREVAGRLGIKQALGNSRQAKLALLQIAGRILTQGSRYYLAKEWKNLQAIEKVFGIKEFTYNDLYKNLNWLSENQAEIEKKIYQYRHNTKMTYKLVQYFASFSLTHRQKYS